MPSTHVLIIVEDWNKFIEYEGSREDELPEVKEVDLSEEAYEAAYQVNDWESRSYQQGFDDAQKPLNPKI